ncbi:MAG: ABC transporter ATP-binding protein [Akkermansiaceae bacterium]|nr:ABC transporter ATP-binding protein [Akkermansiaceae bacterium]
MSEEKQPNVKGPPVLRLQGLSKSYEKVVALDGVSLAIGEGEFVALRGPSGAGKSTLLYLVAGLLTPDEGSIQVAGAEVSKLSGAGKTRFRKEVIGLVFQDARLIPYLDIRANILAAGGDDDRAMQLMTSLGLEGRASHVPGKLSAGEQQRVGLARALVHRPTLVLADEPTGNLDDVSAEAVVNGLRQFVEDGGSVLVVTHDPRVLEKADRVLTLEEGRIRS